MIEQLKPRNLPEKMVFWEFGGRVHWTQT